MTIKRFRDRIISKIPQMDPQTMQSCVQHLARERGFLETIFNTIQEAVLVIDPDLMIQYHNTAAKVMLGLPDDLSHLPISKILKGVDWQTLLPAAGKGKYTASSRTSRQQLELSYPEHRIVQFYSLPMDDTNPNYVLILTDITDTMERAASSAEDERGKLVSMLAAGVAHEIGNPLNSIYLHLQFLQRVLAHDDEIDKEEAAAEVSEARREVERLDTIITQFLHAIRPGKPVFQLIDLKTLVLEALNFMRHEISSREIHVDCLWGENIPFIEGDPNQLKQAFYNLVKNASQAMPQGGTLGITCTASEDFVSLAVSDSGCGIDKEKLSKIFQPYFTTKGSGTGLGLMIVERIVREHHASLSVESSPNEGTTFTITFPRRDRRVKVLPAPKETPETQKQNESKETL